MPCRSLFRFFARLVILLLLSVLMSATLVRFAPGYFSGEEALDPRLSTRSREILERERAGGRSVWRFYADYLLRLPSGDFGRSVVYSEPVASLLRERAPVTLRTVTAGLAIGWCAALALAALSAMRFPKPAAIVASMSIGGALLSLPSAVLATVCLLLKLPASSAVAAVVFPRVLPHAYEQFRAGMAQPHVLMARAKGLSSFRAFLFHALPVVLAPLLALAGISITLALGASIPIEALSDSPGLGQMVWKAALGRDIPVLTTITLLLTLATITVNALADLRPQNAKRGET